MTKQKQGLDIADMIHQATSKTEDTTTASSKEVEPAKEENTNLNSILSTDENNEETLNDNQTLKELLKLEEFLVKESKACNNEDIFTLINLQRVRKMIPLYEDTYVKDSEPYEWEKYLPTIYESLVFISRTKVGNEPNFTNDKIRKLVETVNDKLEEAQNSLEYTINEVIDNLFENLNN